MGGVMGRMLVGRTVRLAILALAVVLWAGARETVGAQSMEPSAANGWVRVPAPGATTAEAYAVVENPTMYAFYLTKASADAAASVELRQTGKEAGLEFFTVPAYGSLDMYAEGFHLLLKDLKKPLAEGDKVTLTLVNEIGLEFKLDARVQRSPTP